MNTVTATPIDADAQGFGLAPLRSLFADSSDQPFPPQVVESVFATDVREAWTTAETRVNMRSRAYRRITWNAYGEDFDALTLKADAAQVVKSRTLAPLWISAEACQVAAGLSSLSGSFGFGTFWPGGRVVVYRRGSGVFRFHRPEVSTIQSVSDSTLTLSGALATFAAGEEVEVAPLIECEVSNATQTASDAINGIEASWQLQEVAGPTCLPLTQQIGTVPAWMTQFEGLPIFDPSCWMTGDQQSGVLSVGGVGSIGEVSVPNVRPNSIPRETFSLRVETEGREENLRYLQFRDSRGGRAFPFWFPIIHESLGAGGGSTHTLPALPIDWREACVASLAMGRAPSVARVVSTVVDGGEETLTLSQAILPGRVVRMRRVRFDSDALRATWITPERVDHDFSVVELPLEVDIAEENAAPIRSGVPLTVRAQLPSGGTGVGSLPAPALDDYVPPSGGGGEPDDGCPNVDSTGAESPPGTLAVAVYGSQYLGDSEWACPGDELQDGPPDGNPDSIGRQPINAWARSDDEPNFRAVYYQYPPGETPNRPTGPIEDLPPETF